MGRCEYNTTNCQPLLYSVTALYIFMYVKYVMKEDKIGGTRSTHVDDEKCM